MQNKCFVCGIGKTEFDNSQGYENHVKQHHAMKNYICEFSDGNGRLY